MERRKRVLVAPLDWGLGHATRCIPIINGLLKEHCEVFIASTGNALALLNKELPQLKSFDLPAYDPVYPANGSMVWKMATQLPKFSRVISDEQRETEKIVAENRIDVVISDNRYGCYSNKVKSIFITHQLNILMPMGWGGLSGIVNYFNLKQIKKFSECWIPDVEGKKNLGGRLAKPNGDLNTRYIGHLSRFRKETLPVNYNLLVIASGPEPQKSILLDLIKKQWEAGGRQQKIILVAGKTQEKEKMLLDEPGIKHYNYLTSEELNSIVEQSSIILSRSGYSTVLDLAKLGKKAIFIPTPGQTEQEYLAQELMRRGVAFSMKQSEFDLTKAIRESEKFTGFMEFEQDESLLNTAIRSIIK